MAWSGMANMFTPALRGDRQGVLEAFECAGASQLAARSGHTCPMVASCFARTGDDESAIEWVQRAVEMGFTNHRFLGELSPLLSPLTADHRMRALLDQARRVEEAFQI